MLTWKDDIQITKISICAVLFLSLIHILFRADMGSGEAYEKNVAALAASYPLGRIAVPEDIAPTVLFLAGEDSAFMTGQYILLDGGFTLQ